MTTKILMVCLGNICRSPLAEGILKSKIDSNKIKVDSAGTGGYHIGKGPDTRSVLIAKRYHIDIANQRCRQFSKQDFMDFDVIYVMDKNNHKTLLNLAENSEQVSKIKLLMDEVDLKAKEVPDPYYDDMEKFDEVFHLIDKACTAIAKNLNRI